MKSDLSLKSIKTSFATFGSFLFTHSMIIYLVLFFSVLAGALLGLNIVLNQSTDEDYKQQKMSEAQSPRFDTETIKKIQNLNAQQQTITENPPAGQRSNPFSE